MSDKAKKNLASAQAIVKMFESGDFSKVGDYIANDAVDHTGMNGETKGLDNIKAEFNSMGQTMSDMKNDAVKEVADDDYVFQWVKESWTQKKDEMGMKAGSKNSFDVIEVSKFNADSKVTDHWSFINANDMMKMMPQQSTENKTDTTTKNK
jgi:predicted ester cyclase